MKVFSAYIMNKLQSVSLKTMLSIARKALLKDHLRDIPVKLFDNRARKNIHRRGTYVTG